MLNEMKSAPGGKKFFVLVCWLAAGSILAGRVWGAEMDMHHGHHHEQMSAQAQTVIAESSGPAQAEIIKSSEPAAQAIGEYFESTVYVCKQHPGVEYDKPGKCPLDGTELIPEKVCYTYGCIDPNCDIIGKKEMQCPVHHKQLKKMKAKVTCPNCGAEVNPETLKVKPVK